jgi:hypothetical protein
MQLEQDLAEVNRQLHKIQASYSELKVEGYRAGLRLSFGKDPLYLIIFNSASRVRTG